MKGLEQIKDEINLLVQDIEALDKDSKIEAMQHLRESVKLLDLGNEEAEEERGQAVEVFNNDWLLSSDVFVADVKEEINEEIKESFEEAGGKEFTYIPCLNDNNAHISALSSLIEKNLSGWID